MESQNEEWKESFRDEALNTICGFANTGGGKLIIGKRDNGDIVGVRNAKKLMEEVPNTVYNLMGIHPDVETLEEGGKTCVVVTVKKQKEPVFLSGLVYIRSGSTTMKLTGNPLNRFLLRKWDMSWTDLPAHNGKLSKLSSEAIDMFVRIGIASKRMSPAAVESDHESILKRYKLITDEEVTNAAMVLFSENPMSVSYAAVTKIGAFTEDHRLLRDDRIGGPIISQPDRVMDVLLEKYVQGTYDIEGLRRVTKYPYPEKALREALLNATVHRDYSSVMDTSIKVFPDRVEIFNPGCLPYGWTEKELLEERTSLPANPLIARVFYDMGYIENWAAGIPMMRNECIDMGISEPEFKVSREGIAVVFRRAPEKKCQILENIPNDIKLNDTESKVYQIICEGTVCTMKEMSAILLVSVSSIKRSLTALIEKGLIVREGSDKLGKWIHK